MRAGLRGCTDDGPQLVGGAPGFSGTAPVAHAVAVRAQAGEVVEPGLAGADDMERSDVVHFDVVGAELSVRHGEVEAADLAHEGAAAPPYLLDLCSAESGVTLADQGASDEQPSFDRSGAGIVDLIGLRGEELELPGTDSVLDRLGCREHLGFPADQGIDHLQGRIAAPRAAAAVAGMVRCEVSGFPADAVRRPEPRQGEGFGRVDRERTQQLRQLVNLAVAGPEFSPSIPHDERPGQYELVLTPRRCPHAQYRMSVRRDGGCVR